MGIDVEICYRRFGPMVLRRCRALLHDEEAAVDAMHDVFVSLLRREDSLEDRGLSSLCFRVATNVCLNRIRSAGRRPEDADALIERIARAPELEKSVLARLSLVRFFRDEQPSTRVMATLHLRDGYTLEEVAAVTGLSVSGVRKRLRTLKAHVAELEAL